MHGSSADCLISEPTVLKLRFFKFFEKISSCVAPKRCVVLCCRSEWNHVSFPCNSRGEADLLRLGNTVLPPQVSVGFHCQRAPLFVSKPAGNSRNVRARFDAPRCKQVPQIVMRDALCPDLFARTIKRLLAFANAEYFRV